MVILELIHAQRSDFLEGSYLLDTEPVPSGLWMIHDKRTKRIGLSRRCSSQVSDLSAFDGRVLAYRGIDG